MRKLIIFDSKCNAAALSSDFFSPSQQFFLFTLTSKPSLGRKFKELALAGGSRLEEIESTRIINSKAESVRSHYIQFIAELPGKIVRNGKNLKELFAIDSTASLWWFSLIAEKNTFKSDTFNRLVQMEAIIQVIKDNAIEEVVLGFQSPRLEAALKQYLKAVKIKYTKIPVYPIRPIKNLIKETSRFFYIKHVLILLSNFLGFWKRSWYFKNALKGVVRESPDPRQFLLVTHYPYYDPKAAAQGVFKNRFYSGLDESLAGKGKDFSWIALYTPSNTIPLKEALDCARRFIQKGERIYFLEEFSSFGSQLRCLGRSLWFGFRFLSLQARIREAHRWGDFNFYPLIIDDWYASFVGATGFTEQVYYESFLKMFAKIPFEKCVYFLEMHAWEKALLYANEATGHKAQIFGYQHATVPRLLLNYFNDKSEVEDRGSFTMARPDKIVCNGRLTTGYMEESGWPKSRIASVEAIRYNHLKQYLQGNPSWRKKNVVLIICSISPQESAALISMANEALRDIPNIELWLKPHPFLNLDELFAIAEVANPASVFQISNKPIDQVMPDVKVAVVGGSGVAIEALAFGCHVVVVEVPEWMNMSPLRGIKTSLVDIVSTADMFRETIERLLSTKRDGPEDFKESSDIVREFFNLDMASDNPKDFLALLCDGKSLS